MQSGICAISTNIHETPFKEIPISTNSFVSLPKKFPVDAQNMRSSSLSSIPASYDNGKSTKSQHHDTIVRLEESDVEMFSHMQFYPEYEEQENSSMPENMESALLRSPSNKLGETNSSKCYLEILDLENQDFLKLIYFKEYLTIL